jgi:hypothetical protein
MKEKNEVKPSSEIVAGDPIPATPTTPTTPATPETPATPAAPAKDHSDEIKKLQTEIANLQKAGQDSNTLLKEYETKLSKLLSVPKVKSIFEEMSEFWGG